jgi:hypothetical protein
VRPPRDSWAAATRSCGHYVAGLKAISARLWRATFGRELGREEDSAHGTVGFTIPLINSEIGLNLFQTSKIYSKFISGPKIMKPVLLFF